MNEIEEKAKAFADMRQKLSELKFVIEDEQRQVLRRHRTRLRSLAASSAERKAALMEAIDANRSLFARPRTRLFHGVRVGLTKGKGGLFFDDDARVVALIRRHLPEQAETLIRIKESPVKAGLAELDATTLKRLGVHVVDAGDEVVVRFADSEVDRFIDALMAEDVIAELAESAR